MKSLLAFISCFLSLQFLQAQCGPSQSSIDLHANNIQARILNGGDLFTDFQNAAFFPNPDPNSFNNPATIFNAGLWMGGLDGGGNLKLAAVNYRANQQFDYAAGPLSPDGITDVTTCQNWDRHFTVRGQEIAAFLQALPLSASEAIVQFPGIMGWPGRGNPHFQSVNGFDLPFSAQDLAPFYDANGDALYNPLAGDYPAVILRNQAPFVPAQIVWSVFNDQLGGGAHTLSGGSPIQAEIQLTAWAFNCPEQPLLNNTVYTSHKIINRATEVIDSFYIGLWVDFDLGCYTDDYVGCRPDLSTIYCYNQDAVDGTVSGSCSGTASFSDIPIQTLTFLSENDFGVHTLDKFLVYNPGQSTNIPTQPVHYYRNMSGSWSDGTPLTVGGSGYGGNVLTNYQYPDDPAEPAGWSMCSASPVSADVRIIASEYKGQLLPGAVTEMTTAWSVHYGADLPCGIGNTLLEVGDLQQIHVNGYNNLCSPLTRTPVYPADSLELFPNPTNADATLRYGNIPVSEIRIYDASGKWVETIQAPGKEQTTLKLGLLPPGVYQLRILTDQGAVVKQLAVAR